METETDLKLDDPHDNWLTLKAFVIHGEASDFMLASPPRRSSPGHRRALVHDAADGLTINFKSDYPGGVTINSVTSISVKDLRSIAEIQLTGRIVADLAIKGGINFVWDNHGPLVGQPATIEVNLQSVIEELQSEVAALKDRVAALGG